MAGIPVDGGPVPMKYTQITSYHGWFLQHLNHNSTQYSRQCKWQSEEPDGWLAVRVHSCTVLAAVSNNKQNRKTCLFSCRTQFCERSVCRLIYNYQTSNYTTVTETFSWAERCHKVEEDLKTWRSEDHPIRRSRSGDGFFPCPCGVLWIRSSCSILEQSFTVLCGW